MELSRELRGFIDEHLQGRGDKMIPFSGLVIDHQAITASAATEELQILINNQKNSKSSGKSLKVSAEPSQVSSTNPQSSLSPRAKLNQRSKRIFAWCILPRLCTTLMSFSLLRLDLFANQSSSTAGVNRESSIQRQYATALLENDLKNWNAISEFFPPTDAVSRNYYLKSQLQIARLRIEGEDYQAASRTLLTIIDSPYADDVLRTVARIEFGWIQQRLKRAGLRNEWYDRAMRDLSTMVPEKQKLIREALPSRVRTDWETVDYLNQSPTEAQPASTKPESRVPPPTVSQ